MYKASNILNNLYIEKIAKTIPELEEAFKNPLEKEIAYMIATSHEYKNPNIRAALYFVKNYNWEKSNEKLSNLQGVNKPVIKEKVKSMADKMKKPTPLIVVNQFNCIRPQTPGKKILVDGHHRLEAYKYMGLKETPIYKGTFTGKAQKSTKELMEQK